MNVNYVERGDTVKVDSKHSEYDGHTGVVYQLYEEHLVVELENADGVMVSLAWDSIAWPDG